MNGADHLREALADVLSEIEGSALDGPAVAVMAAGLAGMLSAYAETPDAPGWSPALAAQAQTLAARLWDAAGAFSLALCFEMGET